MPRAKLPPRLWLRPAEHDGQGRLIAKATWKILDGGKQLSTGCAADDVDGAGQALELYLQAAYRPSNRQRDLEQIPIADVLIVYAKAHEDKQPSPESAKKWRARLSRLNDFWGAHKLSEINGDTCKAYVEQRGSDGGARRDLEDLRAAITYHAKKTLHRGVVLVSLPAKGEARDAWLTRSEAARLLSVCWRTREMQRRDRKNKRARKKPTAKFPLRHLARFILIGLYTGTRAGAIASASPYEIEGRSFVDLDAGVFHRRAIGKRATNKRQPPVRLPDHLLSHMRRWKAIEDARPKGVRRAEHFVEFNGAAVKSVKTAFYTATRLAKIDKQISPHTLRHTAATWLMLNGAEPYDAAHFLGMSEKVLRDVYGHHHPDFQKKVGRLLAHGHRRVSLRQSLRVA